MSEKDLKNKNNQPEDKEYVALDDERRVKVLSPSMLVFKRFIRNKLAIVGSVFIIAMFLFSYLGGLISPYGESQVFRDYEYLTKDYASVIENTEFRYTEDKSNPFPSIAKAKFILAMNNNQSAFENGDDKYTIEALGENAYAILDASGNICAVASKTIYDTVSKDITVDLAFRYSAEKALDKGETVFKADGKSYTVKVDEDDNTIISNDKGEEIIFVSDFIVNPLTTGGFISIEEKAAIKSAIADGLEEFDYGDKTFEIERQDKQWNVKTATKTYVIQTYASPNKEHWLGTDGNGMDILTRLMYGGRVSLMIGFIVVIIETVLGVILGGISGYFGGWVDNLIMRIVDIFNCIPSTPLIIILGAMMDAMQIDPQIRMIYLMIILGLLGWPGIARLVRGQILSLREQEFMTATEATGLSVYRRIFKHLVPNVIPQLIVICTMGLGSVILTESTLSFLGLGVKFPFASWGNIINAVSNVFVMTNYWFVWIPAGFCILITVLGFNFVGDGLRDAFDPKMKR